MTNYLFNFNNKRIEFFNMTLYDLSLLEEIRPSKDALINERLIDFDITTDSHHLNGLKDKESQLQKKYQSQQDSLQKKKDENLILLDQVKSYRNDENYNPNGGDFFHRLRSFEAEHERVVSEISNLNDTITNLRNQIGVARARKKTLTQKINDLREKLNSANDRKRHFVALLDEITESHDTMTQSVEDLENQCELIKSRIKKKAEELKKISPQDTATMTIQKRALENEFKEKQAYLIDLKNKEKQQKSRMAVTLKKRKNLIKNQTSPINWMSERVSYIAKIKKAREEKMSLQKFEKSNQRLTEITEKQKDEYNFTEEEIKYALIAEKKTFVFVKSQFYKDTMETEKEYTEELQQQLDEINESIAQIQKFRNSTLALLKKQEEVVSIGDRISILTDELTDIRSNIM